MNFKGKKILVHGLGISNVAVVKYLADKKAKEIRITDLKPRGELKVEIDAVLKVYPRAVFVLGEHKEEDFLGADIIIKSPSIPNSTPLIQKALEKGIPVESDVTMFLKLCPSKSTIGVTGTKGKTTTTTFVEKMLRDQGFKTVIAGNMGIPVMGELNKVTEDTWVVLELSSFMVESMDLQKISPHVAIYTNIFPDHLNKYKSFSDYKNSKKALFRYQNSNDFVLLNGKDEELKEFSAEISTRTIYYSEEGIPEGTKLKLKGVHYERDLAVSFVLARELGLDQKKVLKSAEGFAGVEYRMQNLGVIKGIEFINNTAATTPIAFLSDVPVISEHGKRFFLLGGGADKNMDYKEMISLMNSTKNLSGIAFFKGAGTDKMVGSVNKSKVLGVFDDMSEAFGKIVGIAKKGELVALCPGCASFGVFEDEFDRGAQFNTEVERFRDGK
ncbi:MAG: UDP-N-acetylmuramoyl-L-alanine--D-glutamate ligase [Patescibacteria group bacterium]|jgi:UDP-N-acetylmuramoylalanine--D-glutamate ligase